MRIYFNGKFYAGQLNGVHRVADRLIVEIDNLLAESAAGLGQFEFVLLIPSSATWRPRLKHIRLVDQPRGHTQFWEQLTLPFRYRDGLVVNLCNLAPILHPSKILLLHDVQFLFPDNSYPLRQVLGYRLLAPWMARSSRTVLTVSEYSRQMLEITRVSRRARTSVLYNGSDHILASQAQPGTLQALGLTRGGYAVHIGSTKSYKNSSLVFEAFADARLADVQLVIVGPDESKFREAGFRPPPNCVFAGRVDDAVLRSLYEGAICQLFPSRTEGFGLPPVEAMRCGCPSVVTPAGAIPEVCRDAVSYADVDDAPAWSEAIVRFLRDPVYREEKVRLGRERAEAFSWGQAGRQLASAITAAALA